MRPPSVHPMKVFVISLTRSTERRAAIVERMTQAGVNFEFFDAVDGQEKGFLYSDRADPEMTFKRKGYHLQPGEVACYASHYLLWNKCVDLDQPIVILEDNIGIVDEFGLLLTQVERQTEKYGYIKLSAMREAKRFRPLERINDNFYLGVFSRGTTGASGYLVSPSAARSFTMHSQKFIVPCDDFMEQRWVHGIQALNISPSPCWRESVTSTIGTDRKQKSQRNPTRRLSIYLFRLYEKLMRKIYWVRKT